MAAGDTGPKFFLNTYAADCAGLARRFGAGLEVIEFAVATRMDDMGTWDPVVREHARGVSGLILHAPFHDLAPGSIDPEIRAVSLKRLRQACLIAAGYGMRRVVCHSGYTPRLYPPGEWAERSAGFWQELLACGPAGIELLVENVDDENPRLLGEVIDRVGDACVQACLDVGHANVNSGVPVREWVEDLGSRIGHVHLHNNDGVEDRHWRLDKGNIDMGEMLELLSRCAPEATYTVEAAEEEKCLEWLRAGGWM